MIIIFGGFLVLYFLDTSASWFVLVSGPVKQLEKKNMPRIEIILRERNVYACIYIGRVVMILAFDLSLQFRVL